MEVDSLNNHWGIKDSLELTVHRMMIDSHSLQNMVVVVNDQGTMTRAEDI